MKHQENGGFWKLWQVFSIVAEFFSGQIVIDLEL
jgi:hypothetical protein